MDTKEYLFSLEGRGIDLKGTFVDAASPAEAWEIAKTIVSRHSVSTLDVWEGEAGKERLVAKVFRPDPGKSILCLIKE